MTSKQRFIPLDIIGSEASATPIARAVAAGDDDMALRHAIAQPDQQLAWSQLAKACTRNVWLHHGRPLFGQLMAIPVIHEDAWPDQPPILDNSGCQTVTDAVNACLQGACALLIFARLRNYACVSTWSPSILEDHLRCVHDRNLLAPEYAHKRGLLAGCSLQLSFVFVVVVSRRNWPDSPFPTPEAVTQMARAVGKCLRGPASKSLCLQVLQPELFQDAITTGLCTWLSRLHERSRVQSWKFRAESVPVDAVNVEIGHGCSTPIRENFIVRRHQVGLRGLQALEFTLRSQCAA